MGVAALYISLKRLHSSPRRPRSSVLSSSAGKWVYMQSTGTYSNESPGTYMPPCAITKSCPIACVIVVFPPRFAPVRMYTQCSSSKSRSFVTIVSCSSDTTGISFLLYMPHAWVVMDTTARLNFNPSACIFSIYSAHLI